MFARVKFNGARTTENNNQPQKKMMTGDDDYRDAKNEFR